MDTKNIHVYCTCGLTFYVVVPRTIIESAVICPECKNKVEFVDGRPYDHIDMIASPVSKAVH